MRWDSVFLAEGYANTCQQAGIDPDEALATFLMDPDRIPGFWAGVESNLRAGRMRLLFVADEIP